MRYTPEEASAVARWIQPPSASRPCTSSRAGGLAVTGTLTRDAGHAGGDSARWRRSQRVAD
jgi:hypothetical protein